MHELCAPDEKKAAVNAVEKEDVFHLTAAAQMFIYNSKYPNRIFSF
jgi:hypothetical protein